MRRRSTFVDALLVDVSTDKRRSECVQIYTVIYRSVPSTTESQSCSSFNGRDRPIWNRVLELGRRIDGGGI